MTKIIQQQINELDSNLKSKLEIFKDIYKLFTMNDLDGNKKDNFEVERR